jgi:hypothetical protein
MRYVYCTLKIEVADNYETFRLDYLPALFYYSGKNSFL